MAFFVTLLTFTWLSEISDADVYAYHEADFDIDLNLVSPGATVALSKSGNNTRICSLSQGAVAAADQPELRATPIPPAGLYYNKLLENLPIFFGVVDDI